MPVPDYETLMLPLLRALADGVEHPVGPCGTPSHPS